MKATGPDRWAELGSGVQTTGVGSLPHHNVDAALEYSLQHTIPFLPQIPMRNPLEFMIQQALERFPGLEPATGGVPLIEMDVWRVEQTQFQNRLDDAFGILDRTGDTVDWLEPSSEGYRAWKPFLFELGERGAKIAKIQLAGPMTCQWAVRLSDGTSVEQSPRLTSQIFRLVLGRARCMVRRLLRQGVRPLLVLDEPSLFSLSLKNPRHVMALQELRLSIQALQKEGALVGLHCCSNTDWRAVFSIQADILSFDTGISLEQVFGPADEVLRFLDRGGRFALGIIPTSRGPEPIGPLDARRLVEDLAGRLHEVWTGPAGGVARILRTAVYTPACGLALLRVEEAEEIRRCLTEIRGLAEAFAE